MQEEPWEQKKLSKCFLFYFPKFPSHPTEKKVTVHSKVDISRLCPAYPNAFLHVFLVVMVMVVLKFGVE